MDDMILGLPWIRDVDGTYSPRKGYMDIYSKTREKIRCWYRRDRTIGLLKMKAL
jgi:hypothetical protein